MRVKLCDPLLGYEELKQEIDAAVAGVLASGTYIGGRALGAFEETFAGYCDARHCVGLASGFDALHLGLRALGIGAGDEVILASNSYAATVMAVRAAGAEPVFAEPCPATFNLDPRRAEAAIGPRTRAILPTHLYGQPADLDALLAVTRRHGLKLVEDAAQAHGARYKGRRIGAHGDLVAWSFYPTKNLGAMGDGGAVTTNDPRLAETVRMLGNYGFARTAEADRQGVNSRLDPLQAAILSAKLPMLDAWNARRRRIAGLYREALDNASLLLPEAPVWAESVWHHYVVRTRERADLRSRLAASGIATEVHYPVPPHLQRAFRQAEARRGGYPIAETMAEEVVSLPMGPHLSDDAAMRVIDALLAWDAGRPRADALPIVAAG